MKVLIIEDSAEVVEALSLCFQVRWPEVELVVAIEGSRGLEILRSQSFDIVILDLNLPDIDGFEVLNKIRSFSNVPIIIVTVRGKEDDQARGLEMGADDYIVKPFRPRDLVARVNAVLRRSTVLEAATEQSFMVRGSLTLDFVRNEVHLGDRTIKLTPTECKLFHILIKDAEHTVDINKILQGVWGKEFSDAELLRTYIRRLRDKLDDNPPQMILTKRGEGYMFVSPR